LGYGVSKCGGTQPRAAAYSHFKLLKKPTTLQAVINIRVVNMATVTGAECVFPDLQHVRHMLQTKSACNSHEQNLKTNNNVHPTRSAQYHHEQYNSIYIWNTKNQQNMTCIRCAVFKF
jgi:hypothetical protein